MKRLWSERQVFLQQKQRKSFLISEIKIKEFQDKYLIRFCKERKRKGDKQQNKIDQNLTNKFISENINNIRAKLELYSIQNIKDLINNCQDNKIFQQPTYLSHNKQLSSLLSNSESDLFKKLKLNNQLIHPQNKQMIPFTNNIDDQTNIQLNTTKSEMSLSTNNQNKLRSQGFKKNRIISQEYLNKMTIEKQSEKTTIQTKVLSQNDDTIKKGFLLPKLLPKQQITSFHKKLVSKQLSQGFQKNSIISSEYLNKMTMTMEQKSEKTIIKTNFLPQNENTIQKGPELSKLLRIQQITFFNKKLLSKELSQGFQKNSIIKSEYLNKMTMTMERKSEKTTIQMKVLPQNKKVPQLSNLQKLQITSFNKKLVSKPSEQNKCEQNSQKLFVAVEVGDIENLDNQNKTETVRKDFYWDLSYFHSLNPFIDQELRFIGSAIFNKLIEKGCYLGRFLAQGGGGVVFDGLKRGYFEQEVVFKIIHGSYYEIASEFKLMRKFKDFQSVVKCIDYFNVTNDIFVLVLEKCQHSLKQELQNIRFDSKEFSLEKLFKIILDLFDGLITLRTFRILHLDIKPDNILVSKDGDCLYSDFGLSQFCSKDKSLIKILGYTQRYAPQEQLLDRSYQIGYKSDIYSLGITIKEILETYKKINPNEDIIQIFEKEILAPMLKSSIKHRYDCEICHSKLLEILLSQDSENIQNILFSYSNKLQNIIQLFPTDLSKDIVYFLQLKQYYNGIQQQILNLKLKQTQSNFQINEFCNQIRFCFRDIDEFQISHSQQLDVFKKTKVLFQQNNKFFDFAFNKTTIPDNKISEYKNTLHSQYQKLKGNSEIFQENDISTADSLRDLGQHFKEIGDSKNALRCHLESLEMKQKLIKADHSSIADSLRDVGLCYRNLGNSFLALNYQLKSLEMYKQIFNGDHPSVAHSLSLVGLCYRDIREDTISLNYFLESHTIKKQFPIQDKADLANCLANVGQGYYKLDKFKEALSFHQESLSIKKKLYQGNHPSIAMSLHYIGLCYRKTQVSEINFLRYRFRSLQMFRQLFERNHQSVSISLSDQGLCLLKFEITKIITELLKYRKKILFDI